MKVLFKTVVGSKLYGLETPTSDTDYCGFGFPTASLLIGLESCEQEEVKDLENSIEGKIYTLQKYFRLLLKGNPTIFELAWADPKFHLEITEDGKEIIQFVRDNLTTQHLFKPFNAYFRAMQHDVTKNRTSGDRLELVKKFGFDTKAASHCARLGCQCIEMLFTGRLDPTLQGEEREICFDIKLGKLSLSEVNSFLDFLNTRMYKVYQNSKLPKAPNYHKINNFLIEQHRKYLTNEV